MGYIGAGISRFNTVNGLSVNADGPTVTGIKDEDNMASNSAVKLATQQSIKAYVDSQIGANNELSEVLANGSTTGGNDISFGDADRAYFGAGNDLEIFSDGTTSYIKENGSGDLRIWADNPNIATAGGNKIFYGNNGVAELYYTGGVKRLETTSGGIDVTGTVTADDAVYVEGSSPRLQLQDTDGTLQVSFLQQSGEDTFLRLRNNTSDGGFTIAGYGGGSTTSRLYVKPNGDISFYDSTGTTQGFFWDASTQSLGLGTTSTGGVPLYVKGQTNSNVMIVEATGTAANYIFDVRDDGTSKFRVDPSGNVGIGTATVNRGQLQIASGSNAELHLTGSGQTGSGEGMTITSNSTEGNIWYRNNGYFRIATNNSERLRIDSSGNLLVGKTANGIANTGNEFAASGYAYHTRSGGITLYCNRLSSDGGIAQFRKDSVSIGEIGVSSGDNLYLTGQTGNTGGIYMNDAAVSPAYQGAERDAYYDLGKGAARWKNAYFSGEVQAQFFTGNGDTDTYMDISSNPANTIKFYTGGSERARLDSSGQLMLNCTSDQVTSYEKLTVNGSGGFKSSETSVLALWQTNASGNVQQFFSGSGGTLVGSIYVTGSGTTYNTTSDIRLKTDIAPIADATDKLMAMNAVSHKWKADPDADAVVGFIAQEMAEIVPEAVSGDPDGEEMMSMDYGRITPVIVAALQEANKKIAELETRIKELETK